MITITLSESEINALRLLADEEVARQQRFWNPAYIAPAPGELLPWVPFAQLEMKLRKALNEKRERINAQRVNDEHGFKAALLKAYDELAEKIKNAHGANF